MSRWLLAGYAGLAGFAVLEIALRRPGSASSLEASPDDRGTTRAIAFAYAVAVDVPLLARWLPGRQLPAAAAPAGLVLQGTGLALRAWSMRTLGTSYSRTLRTAGRDHDIVDVGPYRWIRHPGYTGSLLTWIGFALTARTTASAVLVPAVLGAAYARRIEAEEELLCRTLPDYPAYARRTARLVPLVW